MTIERTRPQDAEDPTSIMWWEDYAQEDRRQVSSYLFESGESATPLGDFVVDASDFTSHEFHEREVAGLWSKVWQMACRANDIPQPGDYLEYQIARYSILIVRDTQGKVQAFRNACRHRGTAVASGTGHKSSGCFVCPFHGWTYGLDGSLEVLPAAWDFPEVDRVNFGLTPVKTEIFQGWVFVNPDPDAPPFSAFLGDTVLRHLAVHPDDGMWKAWHLGMVVQANWKVVIESMFEGYHVSTTHPSARACVADIQSRYDIFGIHSRGIGLSMVPSLIPVHGLTEGLTEQDTFETATAILSVQRGLDDEVPQLAEGMTTRQFIADHARREWGSHGIDLEEVSDAELVDAVHYDIFPNFLMDRHPVGKINFRFRPNGDDQNTSIFEVMHLRAVPPGQDLPRDSRLRMLGSDEHLVDYIDEIGGTGPTLDQDVSNYAMIQKGLQNADKIVLSHKMERNIVAFHRNLASFIARAEEASTGTSVAR